MKKKEKDIATGLDREFKKDVAKVRRILVKYYSRPEAYNYYEYMLDQFVELSNCYTVLYAIRDNCNILKALKEHYQKNEAFANSLDRISRDGHDCGGIVDAGERLEGMFKFFNSFADSEFTSLIELRRLELHPEQYTKEDLGFLEMDVMG